VSEWWRGAVIYQVYPRSFCDSTGDGVSKLEYVADLGVDAIWISPFFKSPMKDFGYDVEDFRQVDSVFGDLDDFDALIRKAHSLGLKVVIDQVYSHSSDQCDWFKESRQSDSNSKADWYTWANAKQDGSQITGNLLLAVPPGPGTIPGSSITYIISCRNSLISTCITLKSAGNC
jgi:alpha-glucosidase